MTLAVYDCTYSSTRLFSGSGTSVCVCEPQSVGTPVIRLGERGLLTSKIRMPSKPGVCGTESHCGEDRGVSTETNSRFCQTDTSCCEPGHAKSTSCRGLRGFDASTIWKPS